MHRDSIRIITAQDWPNRSKEEQSIYINLHMSPVQLSASDTSDESPAATHLQTQTRHTHTLLKLTAHTRQDDVHNDLIPA